MERTDGLASSRSRMAARLLGCPWLLTILLASFLCAAYLAAVFIQWGDAADRSLYANLGMIPIGLVATILARSATKAQGDTRSRWAWGLLAVGLACFFAGDVLFFFYQNVLGRSPFPSLADAGYLAYYPLVFAGLLCFPRSPKSRLRGSTIYLVCALVILAGGALIIRFFLLPTLGGSRDDLLAYSLAVGYPLGDLLLLAGTTWLVLRRLSGESLGILLLSGGLVVGLLADVVYGYQSIQGTLQAGGFSDAAYMVSWALFAWAGYGAGPRHWLTPARDRAE